MYRYTELKFDGFERNLQFKRRHFDGFQWRFKFENGYGASVVKFGGSYGYCKDLFELTVFKGDKICYDTPITSDVLGYLTNDEVLKILGQIKDLKECKYA